MKNDSRNRLLIVGTLTYSIGNLGTKILSFLIVPLYTFYISTADMGDYDLLMTTASLFSPLLTLKISEASYRWIINDREKTNRTISATYQLLFRNCLLCSIIIIFINHFIPIWNCFYFIGILLTDRIMECVQKLLRGLGNQKLFAASGLIYTVFMVTYNLIQIVVFHSGVKAMLQGVLLGHLITILFVFICEKRLRVFDIARNYRILQKDMIKYSAPLVPSTLCWWVMNASDRYLIRWLMGKSANGVYAIAHKFPTILSALFVMFNNAWTDMVLSQMDNSEDSIEYSSKLFKIYYTFSFGMALVLIPLTKIVTNLILSGSYKNGSVLIGFLYIGAIFQGFSSFCSVGYLQNKKTIGAASSSAFGAVVNIIVDLALMKYIGLYAAALSTLLGYFVMWCMRMHDIKDIYPIRIDKISFSINLGLCIIMAIISTKSVVIVDFILSIFAMIYFYISNSDIINIGVLKCYGRIRKKAAR